MSKYIRKEFSPHIYRDWTYLFKSCTVEQRSELLIAITEFPNYEPKMYIPVWDFIKSQLENQYKSMDEKSQQMSENRAKKDIKKQKSTEVDKSQPKSTKVDKSHQIEIETRIETGIETGIERESIERKKTVNIRGAFVPPTLEEVLSHAKQMNEIPEMGGFVCSPQTATDFFNQYDRQGWLLGNGIHMSNWKSGLRKWANEQNKQLSTSQFGSKSPPRMSMKEMKEIQNHINLQKMLSGEL